MSDQIPPPGPERDAEIARLLGWRESADSPSGFVSNDGTVTIWPNGFSTDPAAADRLVEELVRRDYLFRHQLPCTDSGHACHDGAHFVRLDGADGRGPIVAHGATRPDAASAAALLALRGAAPEVP